MEPEERERQKDQLAVRIGVILAAAGILAICWAAFGHSGTVELIPPQERVMAEPSQVLVEHGLDLNTADAQELEQLPGIGETLARRILRDREENGPFASVEDLTRVEGIGQGTLEEIWDYVTVQGE